ncbi:hypothetical protein [Pseudomonas sp. Marseille-Q5115]|uniref:hypothetical protein n=1 Tax=Pseudomonas sp. Marseille-Q5115 TaxID=2866593 RepID=UPI001CE4217C|nr:hypothetical protein [Pseudomonas sp. Marseille-Q5115]
MRKPLVALALTATLAGPAGAITLGTLTDADLRRYSAALADHAGSSQWQLLWQNSRAAGHFKPTGAQPRFTLPMRDIPALVQQTLAEPDRIDRLGTTRTRLRRNISPRIAGEMNGTPLNAICLTVDWRGASEPASGKPTDPATLRFVSLIVTEPC